jgi:hypothetical protein
MWGRLVFSLVDVNERYERWDPGSMTMLSLIGHFLFIIDPLIHVHDL